MLRFLHISTWQVLEVGPHQHHRSYRRHLSLEVARGAGGRWELLLQSFFWGTLIMLTYWVWLRRTIGRGENWGIFVCTKKSFRSYTVSQIWPARSTQWTEGWTTSWNTNWYGDYSSPGRPQLGDSSNKLNCWEKCLQLSDSHCDQVPMARWENGLCADTERPKLTAQFEPGELAGSLKMYIILNWNSISCGDSFTFTCDIAKICQNSDSRQLTGQKRPPALEVVLVSWPAVETSF